MKIFYRIFILALVVALIINLCACGNQNSTTDSEISSVRDIVEKYADENGYSPAVYDFFIDDDKNELDGVLVSFFGETEKIKKHKTGVRMTVKEDDGNIWLCDLSPIDNVKNAKDLLLNDEQEFFGQYTGIDKKTGYPIVYINFLEIGDETFSAFEVEHIDEPLMKRLKKQ